MIYNSFLVIYMQDLFLDYENFYKDYTAKKDLFDKMNLYHFEILDGMYRNILELKAGNDLICVDYMDYSEYTKMIAQHNISIYRQVQADLDKLEKDLIVPSFYYRAICYEVMFCGLVSCTALLEMFKYLGIEYSELYFHNGIKDEEGMTLSILDNSEYKRYTFFGNNYIIRMLEVKDGEIIFDSKLEYLLGTDFIRFFANWHYNRKPYDIKAICSEYKKSCLNR